MLATASECALKPPSNKHSGIMQGIVGHSNGRLKTCTRTMRAKKLFVVYDDVIICVVVYDGAIIVFVQAKRRVCRNACTPMKNMPTANSGSASAAMLATNACSTRSKTAARACPRRTRAAALTKANTTPAPTPIIASGRIS